MSKRKKKEQQRKKQMIMALSAAFLFITVCAGTAAFLRKDDVEDESTLSTDVQQEQSAENSENTTQETQTGENTVTESETPATDDESASETTEGEETEVEEETFIYFNKPSSMRAAVVKAGEDFLTDTAKSDEEQQAEIDAMLDSLQGYNLNTILVQLLSEEGSAFSVSSIKSYSTFDALEYIISAARERSLFVYGIYDMSLYADDSNISRLGLKNTAGANLVEDAFTDFIKYYELDGVLLDGCENPEVAGSYSDYMKYGAGRTYEEYLRENAAMMVTSAREIAQKYSPNIQIGLLTDAVWATLADDEAGVDITAENEGYKLTNLDSKSLYENGDIDFLMVENFTSTADTEVPFDTIALWWDGVAAESDIPVYMLHAADRACTTDISAGWAAASTRWPTR